MSLLACAGVRQPMHERRHRWLWEISMYSNSAALVSRRVRNRVRCTRSVLRDPKKLPMEALSRHPDTPQQAHGHHRAPEHHEDCGFGHRSYKGGKAARVHSMDELPPWNYTLTESRGRL